MKKLFKYASLSAIAFFGAVSFSACSSSDDVVENNPNYNPETNSVKTEFAISLPNYVGSTTRQTAEVAQAQATPVFRGMQNLLLIPYGATVTDASIPLNNKVFTLPDFGSSTDASWDLSSQKAKVYKTLDVPIGTKVFMFYGQAKVEGTNFANGKLNAPASYAGAVSTYNFTLQPILTSYTYSQSGDAKGYAICQYLKTIRETSGITSSALQSLLTNFKPIAASSASIQAAVQALWDQVKTYTDGDGKNLVKASIEGESNAYATIDGSDNVTLTGDLTGYPANLYIPDGAVAIDWSTPATPVINGPSSGLNVTDLTKYVYPAALYYRANSTIGVSSNAEVSKNFSTDTWANIVSSDKYTWTGDNAVVGTDTRSIALHDQIQYAVGRFDLSIKAFDGTLYDNYGNAVTVNTENGFPVSAVIIGGQKPVKYDFTPYGENSYTIYDNVMNGTVAAKAGSALGTNHTLVLETASTVKQVNVAVELTNNTGASFRGKDGTVPAGGKFYLVGTLDLDKTSEYTNTNSRSKIFEQAYTTSAAFTINQGFSNGGTPSKDTNTTGLGAAFNVVPDLTVAQIEVAFSVDLTWTTGLEFNISF